MSVTGPTLIGMNTGRVIRAARRARRLSQRELADLSGVPPSTVSRIEAGQVVPRLPTLVTLLSVLGYGLTVVDGGGRMLELDDEHDRLRDRADRRFPAHLEWGRVKGPYLGSQDNWWGWYSIAWTRDDPKVPEYTYWRRWPQLPDTAGYTTMGRWDDAT